MNAAFIRERVAAAGVVGAGGAGFPTHVKLSSQVEWLIANGAECEPLLYADQALMEHRAAAIVRGLVLARKATGARRTVIALKAKYRAAREALAGPAAEAGIELFPMDDFYPAGDEHIIVHQVTGRTIPSGGIPLHVGAVVQNVETLANIARAVDEERPVITKFLTVAGAVRSPVTVEAPIGVPLGALVELAGGPTVADYVLMEGGVLMGRLAGPEEPVTKRTGGVVVLPRQLRWVQRLAQPWEIDKKQTTVCIQCNFCTELCPRYLLGHHMFPNKAMLQVNYSPDDEAARLGAYLCCDCGLCEAFACPELLMPRQAVIHIKQELSRQGIRYRPGATPEREPHPFIAERRVPSHRVEERIGVSQYDRKAPLVEAAVACPAVSIRLDQHIGSPAEPLVREGDTVTAGQLIARPPEGALGAVVHSSVTGRVTVITRQAIQIACADEPGPCPTCVDKWP